MLSGGFNAHGGGLPACGCSCLVVAGYPLFALSILPCVRIVLSPATSLDVAGLLVLVRGWWLLWFCKQPFSAWHSATRCVGGLPSPSRNTASFCERYFVFYRKMRSLAKKGLFALALLASPPP